MDHGVRHLNSSREAVEEDASNFRFEDRDQIAELAQIFFGAVNRRSQVAFQRTGDRKKLIVTGVLHQKSCRPENLLVEIGARKRCRLDLKQCRPHGETVID